MTANGSQIWLNRITTEFNVDLLPTNKSIVFNNLDVFDLLFKGTHTIHGIGLLDIVVQKSHWNINYASKQNTNRLPFRNT